MQGKVQWCGDLTFLATSGSGHQVVMDGDGGAKAPSPMEMVLLAAASCSSVDVVNILQKARQNVTGCEVEVSAIRAESTPVVFTQIHLHFLIAGAEISEKHAERAVRLSADKYCSVSIMLGKSVEISHSFSIRDGL